MARPPARLEKAIGRREADRRLAVTVATPSRRFGTAADPSGASEVPRPPPFPPLRSPLPPLRSPLSPAGVRAGCVDRVSPLTQPPPPVPPLAPLPPRSRPFDPLRSPRPLRS